MDAERTPGKPVDRSALERALSEAPGGADALRGRLLLDLARSRIRDWDVRALPAARHGLDLVSKGAKVVPADLITLGDACLLQRLPEALDRYREASEQRPGGDVGCAAACGEAEALEALGRPHEALLAAQAAETLARDLGLGDRVGQARWIRLRVHLAVRGPDPGLLGALDAVVRAGGDAHWSQLAALDLAVAMADTGRDAEARCLVDRVLARPATGAAHQAARWALGELEWLAGRPERAAAEAETLLETWPDSPVRPFAEVTLAWARLDQRVAPAPVALRFLDAPAGLDDAVTAAALVLGDREQCASAERRFRRSAERLAHRMLREALRSLLGAARAAEGAGDRERARRLRAAVVSRAVKGGFEALGRMARRDAEARGLRRPSRSPRLTASEREVLGLVAEGLTSRGIAEKRGVAPTTVESQIRSAVTKLGARNRLEAAARLVEPNGSVATLKPVDVPDAETLHMLALVAAGLGVEEIAARSAYSPRTVARRLAGARRGLRASTTAQAVALARARGLIALAGAGASSAVASSAPGTTSRR